MSIPKFKFLHESSPGIYFLDHRLTPEVRAMFASMASRLPSGGIRARYEQVVDEVAAELWSPMSLPYLQDYTWAEAKTVEDDLAIVVQAQYIRGEAETLLCEYPLHTRVQHFFDEFVGKYGHSSIQEQTGEPCLYIEESSWFSNWLMFDSPLVSGQEFSTRAVQKKNWPMARECLGGSDPDMLDLEMGSDRRPHPGLELLHEDWMQVFESEVSWWKEHLTDPKNREALGIGDKEPFRPALDRARWALPGTISSGACFTSNVRERSRVIRDAALVGAVSQDIWGKITDAYKEALPGISVHAFREAPPDYQIPGHLQKILCPVPGVANGGTVEVGLHDLAFDIAPVVPFARSRRKTYADPWWNHDKRVSLRIECSLAVARDWHRHRTLYPWHLGVVLESLRLQIDRHYTPMSELGKKNTEALLRRSSLLYLEFWARGDYQRAALALPLGTRVVVSGSGGYRDVVYMLELRAHALGANFEYRKQALEALGNIYSEEP